MMQRATTDTTGMVSAAQQARCRHYQLLLGFNMSLHVVIALTCMFFPDFVARRFDLPLPVPSGWTRAWGATLMLVTALYIPGLRDPLGERYPNICGILGRVWMATTWFVIGGGFFWFGAFDLMFALLLAWFYRRALRAGN